METGEGIEKAAALLRSAKHVVVFTGAGISTASGIPDFRNPTSGLWAHADPMQVASIFGFRANPRAFYDWVHPLAETILNAQPNAAHLALARLETSGHLTALVTQNVDMLHQKAGNKIVHELHGHLRQATCTLCFKVVDGDATIRQFLLDGAIPRCPGCGSILKPNVILFGEQLPIDVLRHAQQEARNADVILIVGSSLEVAPASDIPMQAQRRGAKIIVVNLDPTPIDQYAEFVFHADATQILPALERSLGIGT
jgi:NAD-dependent deacetylase